MASRLRLFHIPGDTAGRLAETQLVDQLLEQFAILGGLDRVDTRADDRHAGFLQSSRQVQRRLTAELNDHAIGFNRIADVEYVFDRQRLKEQDVRRVVVGADRFRVAIDHHAFDSDFAERETGVTAAVIEFNSLADSIGSPAQDHDSLLVALGRQFILDLVGAVVIGCVGLEFRGTGIDTLEHGTDAQFESSCPHFGFGRGVDSRQLSIREAVTLGLPHVASRETASSEPSRDQTIFFFDDLREVIEEPNIDIGQCKDLVDRHAGLHGVANVEDTFGPRRAQLGLDFVQIGLHVGAPRVAVVAAESEGTDFQSPHRLLK